VNLYINFETPHTYWCPLIVYDRFFSWFKKNYSEHDIEYDNSSKKYNGNPSGPFSPHIMVIKNKENGKYIIVSYWDRAIEFTWDANGWNHKNMVDLITSAGVHEKTDFVPFSYTCYSLEFERIAREYRKKLKDKKNNNLLFRGFLYSERKIMQEYKPEFFSQERMSLHDYFSELNDNKICLSLNGAGEICNRDMEILACGSVLLRPKIDQVFHDSLLEDYHYLSVEKVDDPKKQMDLLIEKYNLLKDKEEYLEKIAENGHDWFLRNGTINSNVEILKKVINIEKLK
jgi:hypothetical protein